MNDLAPSPVPTGRHIIQFVPDIDGNLMCNTIREATGVEAISAQDVNLYEEALVLDSIKVGIAELSGGQSRSLAEDDRVLQVRPEFYLFDTARLNAEDCKWIRTGLHRYIDTLQIEEALEPYPWERQVEAVARLADTPELTWGLQAIGVDRTALTGTGIKVAVLDTGLDHGHPDFQDRRITARSFASGEDTQDGNGHGTHVAGTIAGPCASQIGRRYGIASSVELFIGKVLANNGSGREFDVLSGIEWAINQGCHIISMSLGRAVRRNEQPDPLYEAVGQAALDAGCLIIAAAGNESSRAYGYIAPVGSPANASTIMAVAAVDPLMRVSSFSCGASGVKGGEVDIAAPGSSVYSSWPYPRLSRTISGTSMACPHVSGVAALIAQDRHVNGRQLWDHVTACARPLGNSRDFGIGLVQVPVVAW